MTKLINNHSKFLIFIVLLTLLIGTSCATPTHIVYQIKGKQIAIDTSFIRTESIESFIAPYRNHINRDLDSLLSYAPQNMDKSHGKWQTTIGNFLADITLNKANQLFYQKYNKNIDICLLNHGGIRAPIAQGEVTARTAFQVMPFENSLIVAELKAEQILEMVNYFVHAKRAHPIAGIQIKLSSDETHFQSILIKGKPLDLNKTYLVATSDYLITGGDNMTFFAKAVQTFDMNYKLRNLIIDYFKENDTLPIVLDDRITIDKQL